MYKTKHIIIIHREKNSKDDINNLINIIDSKQYGRSKIIFGLGASSASLIFFFILGYGAKAVSKHINNAYAWKLINIFIIIFMTLVILFIIYKEIYLVFLR